MIVKGHEQNICEIAADKYIEVETRFLLYSFEQPLCYYHCAETSSLPQSNMAASDLPVNNSHFLQPL